MAHLNKPEGFSVSLKNTIKFNKTFCFVILIMGVFLLGGCVSDIKLNKSNRKIMENTSMLQVVSRGWTNEKMFFHRHDSILIGTGLIAIGQMILANKRGEEMYDKYNVENPLTIVTTKFLENIGPFFKFTEIKKYNHNKFCYPQDDCNFYANQEEKTVLKGLILELNISRYTLNKSRFRPIKTGEVKKPNPDYVYTDVGVEEGEFLYDFILIITASISDFNRNSNYWMKTCKINSGPSTKFKDNIKIKNSSLKELTENNGKLLREISNMVAEECARQLSEHLLYRKSS